MAIHEMTSRKVLQVNTDFRENTLCGLYTFIVVMENKYGVSANIKMFMNAYTIHQECLKGKQ